jgi:hypothetical protein
LIVQRDLLDVSEELRGTTKLFSLRDSLLFPSLISCMRRRKSWMLQVAVYINSPAAVLRIHEIFCMDPRIHSSD